MTLSSLLKSVRSHWRIVLLSILLGGVGAGTYSWLQTPMYAATTQIFVSASGVQTDAGDLNQGGSFVQERVRSYVQIVDSPVVGQQVIRSLALPYTAAELAEKIDAKSSADTVLIDITVTDESPTRARDIAAAIAGYFPALVTNLETSPGARVSPVKVSVTKPATAPESPVSPKWTMNVLLGLLVGVTVGVAAAVGRELLDRTLREADELAGVTSAPVLSTVPYEEKSAAAPLIIEGSAQSARAEAMRQLRTNLQFVNVDRPLRSIVVTSAVPNEGKSTTSCNLGIAFAEAGYRVLLVDADLRRPKLAEYLDLEGAVGLTNVLAGQVALVDAMQQWGNSGLWVLSSGAIPPNPSELLGSRNMADLLVALTEGFDMVIIDTPPLLPVTDAAVIAAVADGCLLVSRYGKTKTTQAAGAAAALTAVGARLHGCVFNMVPRKRSSTYYYGYTPLNGARAPMTPARAGQQPPVPSGLAKSPSAAGSTTAGKGVHPAPDAAESPASELKTPTEHPPTGPVDDRSASPGQQSSVKVFPQR